MVSILLLRPGSGVDTKWSLTALPPQDPCWDALQNSLLAPTLPLLVDSSDLSDECVADEIVLKTKFKLRSTACPVKPENSVNWTETERDKLKNAVVAENIEDLGDKLANFYDKDGDRKDDENYLCVAPEIADGRVLTIKGDEDELVAMVVTNIAETLPHLEDTVLTMMSAILEGEVYKVDLRDPDYEYCASHKVVWNRYPEKGEGAPQDVHPYFEMKEEPEETEQLSEFIQLITTIIEMHLKKYLTKEYNHFKGICLSLVLHSDKQGDEWIRFQNHWAS
ncbi:hypothetical protein C8R47DRAFT_1217743 [Mycena vitilis]|nr:hypothetical protein C8R47DRAFT_1217743 [Mycena vitilis]